MATNTMQIDGRVTTGSVAPGSYEGTLCSDAVVLHDPDTDGTIAGVVVEIAKRYAIRGMCGVRVRITDKGPARTDRMGRRVGGLCALVETDDRVQPRSAGGAE